MTISTKTRGYLNVSVAEYELTAAKSTELHPAAKTDRTSAAAENVRRPDAVARPKTKDLCALTRQLATLLHAGMAVVPALSALLEQLQAVATPRLKAQENNLAQIVKALRDDVNAGSTLSGACAKYPNVFSPLFVNMVAAGEASGTLEHVLVRLADMLERRVDLAGKVKAAVTYPLMMTVVAVGVVVFLLSFVVPGLTEIFVEMNRTLPWPTRLLISVSSFMKHYFVIISITGCAGLLALAAACRTREARLIADRLKLKLPLFGRLFLELEIARLTRTLATLLTSGVAILDALDMARGVVKNSFVADALNTVKSSISKGDNIADAIRKTGLFPPIVYHITATAQAGASIEQGLANIADMYDTDVEQTARVLTSLLEPAVLLVMGVVVGFIVLAVLMPIFEINQVL